MYRRLHVKCPLFLAHLNKIEFSRHIFEKCSVTKFIETLPLGAEFFHVDSQTEWRTDGQIWRGQSLFVILCKRLENSFLMFLGITFCVCIISTFTLFHLSAVSFVAKKFSIQFASSALSALQSVLSSYS